MANFSIGSIATFCYNSVDNVPSNISGIIIDMAHQAMLRVQNWTGDTIGSLVIIEKYQPAINAFTMSELNRSLQIQNGGITQSSIEGLSATRDYAKQAELWEKIGLENMKRLGKTGGYLKTLE